MARRAPPPRRAPTGPAPPRPTSPAPPRRLFFPFSTTSVTQSDHPAVGTMSSRGSDCRHCRRLHATSSCSLMQLSPTSTTPTRLSLTSYSPTATSSPTPRVLRR
ncbi:hypothetical protein VPH35_077900 [Triticum aestivum]